MKRFYFIEDLFELFYGMPVKLSLTLDDVGSDLCLIDARELCL